MTRTRWVACGAMSVGLAWGLGGEWASISHHVDEDHLLDALTGLSYVLGGAIALDRRPGNLIGPLMLASGFTWFCGNWTNIPDPWTLPLLALGSAAGVGVLAHLVMAYPSGRIGNRFEHLVVAAAYALPVGTMLASLVTLDPARCPSCPPPPTVYADAELSAAFHRAYLASAWLLVPLFAAALWHRWRISSPVARQALAPLWAVAWILLVAFSLSPLTADHSGGFARLVWQLNAVLETAVPWIFLYGLLSTRLAQSAIGGLVVQLEAPVPPGRLQGLLAHTLSDPTLEVAYPLDGGRWVDADGRAVALDTADTRSHTMVERDDHSLAALVHDPALDPQLVRATAAAAGMALENERLHAELRARLNEVQASRERIVRAADTERRRVERDLHDGAQQRLLGLALALHTARRQLAAGEPAALARTLDRAGAELASAISELRELARGIHPSVLTDGGLAPALEMLAGRAPFPVAVEVDDERYPPMVEGTAYFVVSEALANAAKHAAARRGAVTVRPVDSALLVEVCDDGRGIGDHSDGTGLAGLRDRVAAVGGDFTVDSTPGAGTSIRALLPLRAAS